jgi:Domain of unknown function (DUF4166)
MHRTSIVESAMGGQFAALAPAVQQFHRLAGRHVLEGAVTVYAPGSAPARLLARILGTPLEAVNGPIKFEIEAGATAETWTRHFPSKKLTSTLYLNDKHLIEKVGAARLAFALTAQDGQMHMRLHRLHFFGIPCPTWLMPIVTAKESGIDCQLHFDICVAVRYIGVIARYHGHLSLPDGGAR